jgi:hypothetical protein
LFRSARNTRLFVVGDDHRIHEVRRGHDLAFSTRAFLLLWMTTTFTKYVAVTTLLFCSQPAMVNEIKNIQTNSGKKVFRWGGDFRTIKDAMHFEVMLSPTDMAAGIKGAQAIPPPPQRSAGCKNHGKKGPKCCDSQNKQGVCSKQAQCGGGNWQSSGAPGVGAIGCKSLPNDVRCCAGKAGGGVTGGSTPPLTTNKPQRSRICQGKGLNGPTCCTSKNVEGTCVTAAQCAGPVEKSGPRDWASGAIGCKKLPNAVRCCANEKAPPKDPDPSPPPCRIVDGREGTCVKFGACKRQWDWVGHFDGKPLSTCGADTTMGCCSSTQPPAQVCTARGDPPGVYRSGLCAKSCGSNKDGKSSDDCIARKCCVDKAKQCESHRCFEPFAKIDKKKKRTRCRGITSCEDDECGCKPVLPLCKSFRGCDAATEYVADPKKECFDPAACIASECCEPKASCTDAASYALCQANPLSYAKDAADVQPFCKNSKFCGESECCALRGSCGEYECTSLKQTGATPRAAKDTRCHSSKCTDYECNCENPVITCAMPLQSKGPFQCPADTHVSSSALNGSGVCVTPTCSVDECCAPRDECRTSSVECSRAQTRLKGAPLCATARCRTEECCEKLPQCANYTCLPLTHVDDYDKDATVCEPSVSGKCKVDECCRKRDVCKRSLCDVDSMEWEPRNSQRTLCGEQCTVDDCCRKKQFCPAGRAAGKGVKRCAVGWQLRANSGSIECEANSCSNEECCEPQPRCDGNFGALCDANAGRALVQSPQPPPCAGVDGCTAKHCCGDVQHCGTFDCSRVGLAHKRILANCKTEWLVANPEAADSAAPLPWQEDSSTPVCTVKMCCYFTNSIVEGTGAENVGDDPFSGDDVGKKTMNSGDGKGGNSSGSLFVVALVTALVVAACIGGAFLFYRRQHDVIGSGMASHGGSIGDSYELHTDALRRADGGMKANARRAGGGGYYTKKKRTAQRNADTRPTSNNRRVSSQMSDDGSYDGDSDLMSNSARMSRIGGASTASSTKRAHASFAAAKMGELPGASRDARGHDSRSVFSRSVAARSVAPSQAASEFM